MRKILFRAFVQVVVVASFFLMPYAACAAAPVKEQAAQQAPCHGDTGGDMHAPVEKAGAACCLVACCAPLPQVDGLRLPGLVLVQVAVPPLHEPAGVMPAPRLRPPSV